MDIELKKHKLVFYKPAKTSRNILTERYVYYILLRKNKQDLHYGIGECSYIPGLSIDDIPEYVDRLQEAAGLFLTEDKMLKKFLEEYPSIRFGLETAVMDYKKGCSRILYPSEFTEGKAGIPINGLIWMGNKKFVVKQIEDKLNAGFRCLKLKIGSLQFEQEIEIIRSVRELFSAEELEIRVDANGAFTIEESLQKLFKLAELQVHSIEQPIMPGQIDEMARICEVSPIPVALDEELIGIKSENKFRLLEIIRPSFIILKPSLLGGFKPSEEWIEKAEELNIQWWITSALESNIGLNAIAQWAYSLNVSKPQGLGTGLLYRNNITSPLQIKGDVLYYNQFTNWNDDIINR